SAHGSELHAHPPLDENGVMIQPPMSPNSDAGETLTGYRSPPLEARTTQRTASTARETFLPTGQLYTMLAALPRSQHAVTAGIRQAHDLERTAAAPFASSRLRPVELSLGIDARSFPRMDPEARKQAIATKVRSSLVKAGLIELEENQEAGTS